MSNKPIPKRLSTAIINSLNAGVVPRIGLEYINVGRKDEIAALLQDLENISEGGSVCRFIIGRYGSGKTFLLQLVRNQAMERGYVVADVDLSPERHLTGTRDDGRNTYRELMHNVSTKARPEGKALPAILDRWLSGLQSQVMAQYQQQPSADEFNKAVQRQIFAVIDQMEGLVHGFDYAKVISCYWEGYITHNDPLKENALRWLRGEYTTKTESNKDLGVRVIVSDEDWYDYLKLFAKLVASIGYKGLVVVIDEAVNLYKISNKISRQNNYEKLLTIFNDTMQGKAEHLDVIIGGTPDFLEDTRRGLFSYDALKTRLETSRFVTKEVRDVSGPVIRVDALSHTEILLLLNRVLDVYTAHYNYETRLNSADLQAFMQAVLNRVGANELLTPREMIRDFIAILNVMRQNPELSFAQIIGDSNYFSSTQSPTPTSAEADDTFAEFEL